MAQRANSLSGAEWLKHSFSIWRGINRDTKNGKHPATFPVELVSRLLQCFAANSSGTFIDPFAGSGSSLIAALKLGMYPIGFDINSDYRTIFENRLMSLNKTYENWRYEVHDSRKLSELVNESSVEICVTSPPYWDILSRKRTADGKKNVNYSNDSVDLGNLENYDKFLEAMKIVAIQIGHVLRPKAYFILNIMDLRKGPVFYPLHQDLSTKILETGKFSLEDIIIWDRQSDYNSMRPLGYPYKFVINKVHEYLMVFRQIGESDDPKGKSDRV